jgi:predicted DNA-binding antitoxin AbrB/MazE fold protein
MLKVIEVVFDGTTFVPTEPVDLPTGTKASVELPDHASATPGVLAGPPPAPMTAEEEAEWDELCRIWAATPPHWATVDEAVAAMRRPSWQPPPGDEP